MLVTCGMLVVSSISKTDCHDLAEILLKVALNTITLITLIEENGRDLSSPLFLVRLVLLYILVILVILCRSLFALLPFFFWSLSVVLRFTSSCWLFGIFNIFSRKHRSACLSSISYWKFSNCFRWVCLFMAFNATFNNI